MSDTRVFFSWFAASLANMDLNKCFKYEKFIVCNASVLDSCIGLSCFLSDSDLIWFVIIAFPFVWAFVSKEYYGKVVNPFQF